MNILLELYSFINSNPIVIVLFIIGGFVILNKNIYQTSKRILSTLRELKLEIHNCIQPKFLELSVDVEEMIELATEIWRLEKKFDKVLENLPENYILSTKHSIEKFKRYLVKHNIEVLDFTGQKYNDGLNVDILNIEKDSSVTEPHIKETFEPSIMIRGELVKRAKVIIINI